VFVYCVRDVKLVGVSDNTVDTVGSVMLVLEFSARAFRSLVPTFDPHHVSWLEGIRGGGELELCVRYCHDLDRSHAIK